MESGGGRPGHGPGSSHRPGKGGKPAEIHYPKHHRRKNLCPAQQKKNLINEVIRSGETFISQLQEREIMKLIKL